MIGSENCPHKEAHGGRPCGYCMYCGYGGRGSNERSSAMTEEQVAARWAELLTYCANDHGAPSFAWDLAEHGCKPDEIRMRAERWRIDGFEPREFADSLELFANEVEALLPEGAKTAW